MLTKECNQKRFAAIRQNFPELDMNIVIPNEDYIIRFLQLFRRKYGSAERYLQSIGVLSEEIRMLENKLLGSIPG